MGDSLGALLSARLIFVTGKGGTGKTTIAAALASSMARRGRRTLLCEVDAQRPALKAVFGVNPTLEPQSVGERLDLCNLVWPGVLGSYLKRMVRVGWVVDAILGNDLVQKFLDFTPGAQDLVELSAIDDLCQRYDVVVVDMPASGHAFSLLDITRSALDLFRAGPVRQRATELRSRVVDPATRLLLVALPEEMVVNETIETLERLQRGGLVGGAPTLLLNRCVPPEPDPAAEALLERLSSDDTLDPAAAERVAAGRWQLHAERAAASALERLTAALGVAPVVVPPLALAQAPSVSVAAVSRHLDGLLGGSP